MALEFLGSSLALSRKGFATVAQSLTVKAPEIWSVLAVETSGCGFLADRRPQILYVRHLFHRLTNGRFDDGDISDPKAGGYGAGGAHQYDRLARAIAKDRTAALQSTSWGLGQILGDNFAEAGFHDVESMVAAMSDSEDAQLAAVAAFLRSTHLDVPLQAHDWASFAAGYNGPDFAKNHYDVSLRGEFQKYSFGVMPDLDLRAAQLYLTFAGFDPGPVDGILGTRTRAALIDFQNQEGLPASGEVDDAVLEALVQLALG
jgi:hypothetical protein